LALSVLGQVHLSSPFFSLSPEASYSLSLAGRPSRNSAADWLAQLPATCCSPHWLAGVLFARRWSPTGRRNSIYAHQVLGLPLTQHSPHFGQAHSAADSNLCSKLSAVASGSTQTNDQKAEALQNQIGPSASLTSLLLILSRPLLETSPIPRIYISICFSACSWGIWPA